MLLYPFHIYTLPKFKFEVNGLKKQVVAYFGLQFE
jgi:hypothetical protein